MANRVVQSFKKGLWNPGNPGEERKRGRVGSIERAAERRCDEGRVEERGLERNALTEPGEQFGFCGEALGGQLGWKLIEVSGWGSASVE